jgi:hypothetical protein
MDTQEKGEVFQFSGLIKNIESGFANNINQIVIDGMCDHPELGLYVTDKMNSALTTSERALIGETSLVVYKIVSSLPVDNDSTEEFDEDVNLSTWIDITEDEYHSSQKDPNKIYQEIQSDMDKHPELATYVTARMRESVSLEEANKVGKTALIVYKSLIDYPGRTVNRG